MLRKELVKLSAIGVLVTALIFVLGSVFIKAGSGNLKNTLPKAVSLAADTVTQAKSVGSGNLYNALEEQAKPLELKRDPFMAVPIVSEKTLQSGVDLTGIIWDENKPLAIIDGEIVKKGSNVNGKTIVEIKKDRVILSDGKIFTELRLDQ